MLGLGNDLLTDDAVGLLIARELRECFAGDPSIEVCETTEMGLALLDFLAGYDQAFIVDSIQLGKGEPGRLFEFAPESFAETAGRTPHFLGVGETLALGRAIGLQMPETVRIFAVEVADPYTLGSSLSPLVQAAFPALVRSIREAVSTGVRS